VIVFCGEKKMIKTRTEGTDGLCSAVKRLNSPVLELNEQEQRLLKMNQWDVRGKLQNRQLDPP
jgi:hypothetical protein